MSTKGLPNGAACQLAASFDRAGVPVLVVRDFDLAGFKIVRTLQRGTRRAPGTPVVDLGLRLADVDAMGLASEPVTYEQKVDPADYLRNCGATDAEAQFLVDGCRHRSWTGRRVELNAMSSGQFIGWLGGKLQDRGVVKVRPEGTVLKAAYGRAARLQSYPAMAWDEALWQEVEADRRR